MAYAGSLANQPPARPWVPPCHEDWTSFTVASLAVNGHARRELVLSPSRCTNHWRYTACKWASNRSLLTHGHVYRLLLVEYTSRPMRGLPQTIWHLWPSSFTSHTRESSSIFSLRLSMFRRSVVSLTVRFILKQLCVQSHTGIALAKVLHAVLERYHLTAKVRVLERLRIP